MMPQTLKQKLVGLLKWLVTLLIIVPTSVYAGRTVDKISTIDAAAPILLLMAIIGGAGTATFIPTAVDSTLSHKTAAKIFIGLTFGLFASLFVQSRYGLDDVQMLLPAYFLAAIGTPLMVYVVGIAADKDTYVTIVAWIKKRLGMEG